MNDQRSFTIHPRDAKILSTARGEFLRGEIVAAIARYEKLFELYPDYCPIIAELAQIYLRVERERDAEPLLEKLVRANSATINDFRVAANGFRKLGRYQHAIAACQSLLKFRLSADSQATVMIEMVELAEKVGSLDLAERELQWLAKRKPNSFPFLFMAGKVAVRQGRLQTAVIHLTQALELPGLTLEQTVHGLYALGRLRDRMGQFEEAFQCFATAKAVDLPGTAVEQRKAAWMKCLVHAVTAELKNRRTVNSSNRPRFGRPLCFLTGNPRSGTTLLEQMLAAHPAVASADENAAMFQCLVRPLVFPNQSLRHEGDQAMLPDLGLKDLQLIGVEETRIDHAIGQYRKQLEWRATDCNPQNCLIDKSPAGLIDLPLIESVLPETRIVVMVRDPRDVCLSCFQEDFGQNHVSVNFNTLESTAEKLVRDLEFWFAFRESTASHWLEVYYEQLVADPESELRRICHFLGLEWSPAMLTFQSTLLQKAIQSPTYSQVREPISKRSIGRWKNYRSQFGTAERVLQDVVRRLGYDDP